MLWRVFLLLLFLLFLHLRLGLSESALAALIVCDGTMQSFLVKVGPVGFGEVKFGVGYLPQQIVADALFATCAYEQLGVGA